MNLRAYVCERNRTASSRNVQARVLLSVLLETPRKRRGILVPRYLVF